jgi:hypothetical protein
LLGVDRHFHVTGELQRAFPELPMVGAGCSWLQKFAASTGALSERRVCKTLTYCSYLMRQKNHRSIRKATAKS